MTAENLGTIYFLGALEQALVIDFDAAQKLVEE